MATPGSPSGSPRGSPPPASIVMSADQFNAFLATVQNTIANNINNNIGTPIAGTTAGSSTNPRLLSSSNINPTGSWIGLSTKDQKQDFEKAIKPVDGWKGITPTVANKDKFFALIRQKAVFHNWLNFLNIPSVNSSGTISGNVIKSPTGMETIKFQLINFKHLLDNQQDVTVDMMEFHAAWMYGTFNHDLSGWETMDPKPPKIIKELNLNLDPNDPTHDVERVASLSKFQHRIVSQVISKTIELHLSDDALKTLMVDADKFKWTDETTQTVVYNGFMMLFMILRVVSPVVMVDASNLRAKLESLHLKQFRFNVVSLVAAAQDLRQKITAKGEACDDNTFYTAVFKALQTGNCTLYNNRVSNDQLSWKMKCSGFTVPAEILQQFIQLYNTFVTEGTWGKTDDTTDPHVVALTSDVKSLKTQVAKQEEIIKKKVNFTKTTGSEKEKKGPWRTNKVGDKIKHPDTGEDMKWCPNHGKTGCYMPADHNHDAWVKEKEAKNQGGSKRRNKRDTSNTSSPKTLKLQAKHRAALTSHLTTKFTMTDDDVAEFLNEVDESLVKE
jgi:hypothetical protein